MPHPKDKQIEKLQTKWSEPTKGFTGTFQRQPIFVTQTDMLNKINELIDCYNSLVKKKE